MQKTRLIVPLLILLLIAVGACDNQKSPQELLKEENKAIDRFIRKNGLVILREYPKDGVFGEKDFYHDPDTRLYIQVIDSGNGTRAQTNQTVLGRYTGKIDFKTNDTARYETGPYQPDEFIYGRGTYSGNACVAWFYALNYVGDGSEVRLIIPSNIGTSSDRTNYRPIYYESLKFTIY